MDWWINTTHSPFSSYSLPFISFLLSILNINVRGCNKPSQSTTLSRWKIEWSVHYPWNKKTFHEPTSKHQTKRESDSLSDRSTATQYLINKSMGLSKDKEKNQGHSHVDNCTCTNCVMKHERSSYIPREEEVKRMGGVCGGKEGNQMTSGW